MTAVRINVSRSEISDDYKSINYDRSNDLLSLDSRLVEFIQNTKLASGLMIKSSQNKESLYQLISLLYQMQYGDTLLNPKTDISNPIEEEVESGDDENGEDDDNDDLEIQALKNELSRLLRGTEENVTVSGDGYRWKKLEDGRYDVDDILNFLNHKEWISVDEIVYDLPVFDETKLRNQIKTQDLEFEEKVEEGNIVCAKCKSRRIRQQIIQEKGGDESWSIYYTCMACGNRFKG
jgi:DNA-directed RNA polymerase subunit M/transcription elongation factor TFIIS